MNLMKDSDLNIKLKQLRKAYDEIRVTLIRHQEEISSLEERVRELEATQPYDPAEDDR